MTTTTTSSIEERIAELCLSFKLFAAADELVHRLVDAGFEGALPVIHEVLSLEDDGRRQRRTDRLRRASLLPVGKTFGGLDDKRLPPALLAKIRALKDGSFTERAANILAFGLPGTGKTHVACAIGHSLVEQGYSVLFVSTYRLVQDLLAAKRDLALPRALKKLDNYDLLILDDIGYVQQSKEEVEVLFTLLAERYERRSVLITSNLVFSQWERIFKDPMTTAAAIDRLVHHSVILEFDVESYRTKPSNPRDDNTPTTRKKKK